MVWRLAKWCLLIAGLGAAVAPMAAGPKESESDGWKSLFDGATLNGWVQRGDYADPFRVEDGVIIGPSARNSFLCTARDYSDFILELEFLIPTGINSGVQIRSQCQESETRVQWQGKEITIPPRRVHGYQIEIDSSPRAWSGGFYDEGRRGWLQNLEGNPAARRAFKGGAWNRLRIECRGDSFKTWINDVPAADAKDNMTRTGFIALQVAHGAEKKGEPMDVRFRNIRLKELP